MSRLLLVRHGETRLNSAQRFWGQTDIELSAAGIKQAEQLRDRLATEKIAAVYTSQLTRARLTAEIITAGRKLKTTNCAELDEINFGWVEGLTFEEIQQRYPELAKELNKWHTRPAFPGGESLDELNERVQKFLPRLEAHTPEETVLIVAHAGILRLMICHLWGLGIEYWRRMFLDLGSLSIVETYPQGTILRLLNDVSHATS